MALRPEKIIDFRIWVNTFQDLHNEKLDGEGRYTSLEEMSFMQGRFITQWLTTQGNC
jgi:hypothetical protein